MSDQGDAAAVFMTDDCDDSIAFEVQDGCVFIAFMVDEDEVAQMKLGPAKQEEFAQLYVAACHQAKVNAEQAARSDGMNAVERAARDLLGIPDNL